MKNLLVLFLIIPLFASGQPFSVKKKQMRLIEVNNFRYYDIHIVLNSTKNSIDYKIDSISFNNSPPLSFKLSVLGKDISSTEYSKGDSILIQATASFSKLNDNEHYLRLYYHKASKPLRPKSYIVNTIQLIDSIKFEHNQ